MSQNRNRGRRYSEDSKLNYGKIVAVLLALVVIIMFIVAIKQLLSYDIIKHATKKEYFAVYSESKWGVINSLGETVIEPSYAEMIVIPDTTQDVFLCTYDINVENGTYKTKAINSKNKELYTEYEQIEALENYDKNQNIWYEEDVLKVKKDGKFGLIKLNGRQILSCEYDDIYTLKGLENSLIIEKNEKVGLADNSGRIVIEPIYTEVKALGTEALDGYIVKNETGKYGVIGANKDTKLEFNYEKIEQVVGNNLYVVTEGEKQKLINSKGTPILEDGFDEIKQILKDSKGIVFVKDGLYGAMLTDGTVKIENTYSDLKQLENGYFIAEKEERYGVIDAEGNEKVYFNYTAINYNKELELYVAEDKDFKSSIIDKNFEVKLMGILSELNEESKYIKMYANGEYKYYNKSFEEKQNIDILTGNTLFLSKKNGKYGYVNQEGKVIVDYIYDDATEQNKFGYAAVQKSGKWGAIDSKGEIVIKPTYELDNNLIINFIGKWHLGEDINMNYYCEK